MYLDASALVKLVIDERESVALRAFLGPEPSLAVSRIAGVELPRVAFRMGGEEAVRDADELLSGCLLLAYDRAVETTARRLGPPSLGTLDTIHLASMLQLGAALGLAVVYDQRLARAARALSLRVESPGATW